MTEILCISFNAYSAFIANSLQKIHKTNIAILCFDRIYPTGRVCEMDMFNIRSGIRYNFGIFFFHD